ncbi:MAG: histidine ammonia-lyase [Bacillota bacterium]|jgi:histidine ammonia-lyase|nr:histidine ammonia-lyase [Bacillota bacterium]NLM08413.1 histidine ammonia-lyase [Clostridiales Family XIII bacterium]
MKSISIGGAKLTVEELIAVARKGARVQLSEEAIAAIDRSRQVVEKCVEEKRVVYGLTTGFGKFSDVTISDQDTLLLQENLIMSHACGVGEPLPDEVVRAMMLLRINALGIGYSGIRVSTVQTLVEMLNKDVIPVIPSKGSLGASGDLVPLAHMSLVLLGMGEAKYRGEVMSGEQAMKLAGITPVKLTSKEGLALINGTPAMCAVGALALADAEMLMKSADVIAALSMEAECGIADAMDERLHRVRRQPGQMAVAENMRRLFEGSRYISRQGELRVQDAYSFRCIPQIHGASRDAIAYVRNIIDNELNAVTDNPLIFSDTEEALSGGNFHGQYLAISLDVLGIALAELANVSERRIERLVNPALSGLPAFLIKNGGLNSGMMIAQYTAASLVSENKVLAHPASVDSIPSSANQEDHVSMGMTAARKAREILNNVTEVLAIEAMCAAQAVEFQGQEGLSPAGKAVYRLIRRQVPPLERDRILYVDMQKCAELLRSGAILQAAESVVGPLQ